MRINKKILLAKNSRKNGTGCEKILWKYVLKDNKYHWVKQRIIKGFVVDFYCDYLKLVIEVDGSSHNIPSNILSDKERTVILESLGIKILRLRNEEIQSIIHDIKKYIETLIDERYKELYKKI